MAEFQITHRPALATPFPQGSALISFDALPDGTVVQILCAAGSGDLTERLAEIAGADGFAVRAAGPGQWFIVGDKPIAFAEMQSLSIRLAPQAYVVDQSHGRVRIAAGGSAVTRMLAKGTAVDLETMVIGQSATTLIGHISVHMTRIAADRFELMVLRGFAESLQSELVRMGAEFA